MNADKEQLLIMISEDEGLEWVQMVRKAWQAIGQIQITSRESFLKNDVSTRQNPSCIIVDASSIHCDLVSLVKDIQQQNENVPIVIASASPNWEQARDVLHAGAADYVKRTADIQTLLDILIDYAGRASPPTQ